MTFYYSYESAPLKFHKAFYKVISPILIAIQAILLFATIGHLTDHDGYYDSGMLIVNLFLYAFAIILLSLITYGFANKKEYAWYMVYGYLCLNFFSNILSASSSAGDGKMIGQIIGTAILSFPIAIYYYKRKPIFITSGEHNSNEIVTAVQASSITACEVEENPQICFCRKCGSKRIENGSFCNKCGSKIDWN